MSNNRLFGVAAAATVYKLALDMGKTPVVVQDGPGPLSSPLSITICESPRNEPTNPSEF